MSHPTRTAKSGKDWTTKELLVFNISVVEKDAHEFFGHPLPYHVSHISSVILDNAEAPADPDKPTISRDDEDFFKYLDDAARVPHDEESFVVDFVVLLLRLMGYSAGELRVHTRKSIPFEMCAKRVSATPDVCVMSEWGLFFLVVQEDKRHFSAPLPEPALIAEAIAAFDRNNSYRRQLGKKPLDRAIIPGITIVGSAPMFYKIPVSKELVTAVITGQYPTSATIVEWFVPPVQDRGRYEKDGMKSLENRRIVLKTFEAFRKFVAESDWTSGVELELLSGL